MKMHKSRNLTSHTYNEETAKEIIDDIRTSYVELFDHLYKKLNEEEKDLRK